MEAKSKNTLFYTLIILGILVGSYLLFEHYNPSPSKFCNFGKSFDCGIVNKSPYSTIDGFFYLLAVDFKLPVSILNLPVPVAGLGILTLLLLAYLMYTINHSKTVFGVTPQKALKTMKILLVIALLFSLYLFLIEMFILKTYCVFCIVLDIILLGLTWITFTKEV